MQKLNKSQILIMSYLNMKKIIKLNDFNGLLREDANTRIQELASYINELEEFGYIRIVAGTYAKGGRINPVYKNNVQTIWFDRLLLLPAGKEVIEDSLFDIIDNQEKESFLDWLKKSKELIVKYEMLKLYGSPRGPEINTYNDTILISKKGIFLKESKIGLEWQTLNVNDKDKTISTTVRLADVGANLTIFINPNLA